jgi:hypothetical protein
MQVFKKIATAVFVVSFGIAVLFFNALQLVPTFLSAKTGWNYFFGEERKLTLDERVARIVAEEQKDVGYSDSVGTFIEVRREGFTVRRIIRANIEIPMDYENSNTYTEDMRARLKAICKTTKENKYYNAALEQGAVFQGTIISMSGAKSIDVRANAESCALY